MKQVLIPVTAAFLFFLTTSAALAQGPGSGGPEPQQPQQPTAVPIDGGASLLLAAGAAYGWRRIRNKK
ncbi:PID-CTERM protein-sorting domain-containing protein [Hymenobacter sediminicola]|uniref:VPEID-CTERM sorting domain-containing protein n=1 Tax=Hymenobacter sediminicola TaxID=2761579 RepID=A0A7G7W2E8_9BACT|nr:hypothetical protein [Hymenobacter sediminicola]QNH60541.1 hypothetical protein H4317_10025 [Hymenobacter sediminicola]